MPRPDTRTRLLLAAARSIEKGGEGALNVRAVAEAAGVTVPSVYHFFGSREGLVEEAQAHRFEEGMRLVGISFDEAVARATSKKKYRDTIEAWLHAIISSPGNARFRRTRATVVGSAANNPRLAERIATIQEEQVKRIATYLTYGRNKGWLDADLDVEAIIAWTITQLNGRVILEIDPRRRYSQEWNALFVSSIMHALRFD